MNVAYKHLKCAVVINYQANKIVPYMTLKLVKIVPIQIFLVPPSVFDVQNLFNVKTFISVSLDCKIVIVLLQRMCTKG